MRRKTERGRKMCREEASEATKDPILRDSVHYLWTICHEPSGHSNGAAVVFDRLKSFLVLQYLLFTTKFLQSPSIELPLSQKNWHPSTIHLKYCSNRLTSEKYVLYFGALYITTHGSFIFQSRFWNTPWRSNASNCKFCLHSFPKLSCIHPSELLISKSSYFRLFHHQISNIKCKSLWKRRW